MLTDTADNTKINGMAKLMIILAILPLVCCNGGRQTELSTKNRDSLERPAGSTSDSTKTLMKNIAFDTSTLGLNTVKQIKIGLERKVSTDLRIASDRYGRLFNQPLPTCEQCTELEMLLVLERAINVNAAYPNEIKGVLSRVDKKNAAIGEELKKIEAAYEEKFMRPIPWWWACSYEERLKRLGVALNANVPYPDYSSNDYRLGKALAGYELWFKKWPPDWCCSNDWSAERLELAITVGVPYLTKEDDTKLEATLKTGFKKKVVSKKPITLFERSIVGVDFKIGGVGAPRERISVVRTAIGATAKYRKEGWYPMERKHKIEQPTEMKLDIREWLLFVNALHRCQISDWEKRYDDPKTDDGTQWSLSIFFSVGKDNDHISVYGSNAYPPSWDRFKGIMDDMEARIKNEQ